MTTIDLPAPAPKRTIIGFRDAEKLDPIWATITTHRIRDHKQGWIELPARPHRKDAA